MTAWQHDSMTTVKHFLLPANCGYDLQAYNADENIMPQSLALRLHGFGILIIRAKTYNQTQTNIRYVNLTPQSIQHK